MHGVLSGAQASASQAAHANTWRGGVATGQASVCRRNVLTSEGNRSESGPRTCSNDGFSLHGECEADRPDAWTRGKLVARSCALCVGPFSWACICEPQRRRSTCKECGGRASASTRAGAWRSTCKECREGGGWVDAGRAGGARRRYLSRRSWSR